MNWLDVVVGAAKEANEAAHGARLKQGFNECSENFGRLHSDVQIAAFAVFLKQRAAILGQAPNWSAEGRIKNGRHLQNEARRKYDFNLSEAYGLWMAGAWLESGVRSSPDAQAVHQELESLAKRLILNLSAPSEEEERLQLRIQRTVEPNLALVIGVVRFLQRAIGAASGLNTKIYLQGVIPTSEMRLIFLSVVHGIMISMAHDKGLSDAVFDSSFHRIFEILKNNDFELRSPADSGVSREAKRVALSHPYEGCLRISMNAANKNDPLDAALTELLSSIP